MNNRDDNFEHLTNLGDIERARAEREARKIPDVVEPIQQFEPEFTPSQMFAQAVYHLFAAYQLRSSAENMRKAKPGSMRATREVNGIITEIRYEDMLREAETLETEAFDKYGALFRDAVDKAVIDALDNLVDVLDTVETLEKEGKMVFTGLSLRDKMSAVSYEMEKKK